MKKSVLYPIFMICLAALLITACSNNDNEAKEEKRVNKYMEAFTKLEEKYDARLGVYALNTENTKHVSYRADERFAFGSTYKALAAGAILKLSEEHVLDELITYTEDDLVEHSPITEQNVHRGMTLRELCEAAIQHNDNTAGNILLKRLEGPEEFQEFLRKYGDITTEITTYEPDINNYTPGDDRNTSSPRALTFSLLAFTVDTFLAHDKQTILHNWMRDNTTSEQLIRASLPKDWDIGDVSGTATYGTLNNLAIVWPDKGDPIIMAIMSDKDSEDASYDEALIADAAKVVFDSLK